MGSSEDVETVGSGFRHVPDMILTEAEKVDEMISILPCPPQTKTGDE